MSLIPYSRSAARENNANVAWVKHVIPRLAPWGTLHHPRVLATLHDTLLPNLLSGKWSVAEFEPTAV